MKRLIVALLVGGMVFGTVFAVAASLGVNGAVLQAGSDVDLECDDGGVDVEFWPSFDSVAGGYVVDGGLISDIDEDCWGGQMKVTLTDEAGEMIGSELVYPGMGSPAGEVMFDITSWSPRLLAEDLYDIHIVITK